MMVCLAPGCGRDSSPTGPASVRTASYRQGSAREFLSSVFIRYRNAGSYRDSAYVRMSLEQDDRYVTQRVPIRVWLNHDQIYVEAYRARIWSDGTTMTSWVRDDKTGDFDSQVVQRSVRSGRPDLNSWMEDPVLAGLLEEGTAGPAPQLDWLFSSRPMERLFDKDNEFVFGDDREVDGHLCVAVEVRSRGDRFRFWVDAKDGIIRRVDLPVPTATTVTDLHIQSLSIELAEATFDTSVAEPKMDPLPARPQFVRQFVGMPPDAPPSLLGARARPFRLTVEDGSFTVTELGSDRNLTLLVRADTPAAGVATDSVATMQKWRDLLPSDMSRQMRIAVVVSPSASRNADNGMPKLVDHGGIVSGGYQMKPGAIVVIRGGEVVWTQPQLTIEGFAAFGTLIADALRGVDIPGRYREQWRAETERYHRALIEQRISSN